MKVPDSILWSCAFAALAVALPCTIASGQGIPSHAEKSGLSTYFLPPSRIVWKSGKGVQHAETLLKPAPGFSKVRIDPDLGDLQWAEGSHPTPQGIIKVRHERQADGSVKSAVTLPPGVVRIE